MTRMRVSTTVDADLLDRARLAHGGTTDAALFDSAMRAFLAARRAAEIDASYERYVSMPMETADEWGDLEAFRRSLAELRADSA
jgi:hypothetical protein